MAQTNFTPIQLYYSSTAAATPSAGNLASGELALNITDGKLFYKDNGGSVQVLATKAGASGDVVGPGSSTDNALVRFDSTTGKLVQNSAGILDDSGNLTGIAALTASGALTLNGGTANGVAYLNGSKVLTTGSALTYNGTGLGIGSASAITALTFPAGATVSWGTSLGSIDYIQAGSGSVAIGTNGSQKAVIDSSGNLGLGVTPSAWYANSKVLQIVGGTVVEGRDNYASLGFFSTNVYRDSSATDRYIASLAAAQYIQDTGVHKWFNAPSGTAGNAITFTQAMTLDASGNLLVGATSNVTNGGFEVFPNYDGTGSTTIEIGHISGSLSTYRYAVFKYGSTDIGSITQNGTTGVLYNIVSDQRLKENIQDAAPASALIDALQVREYDWKSDGTHQRYGFIAQELVTVAPEAVHQPVDPEEMMAVDYSKLVPMLVKEIQSLRQRLAALEAA